GARQPTKCACGCGGKRRWMCSMRRPLTWRSGWRDTSASGCAASAVITSRHMNTLIRLVNYLRFSHFDSAHFGGSYEERERFNTGIFVSPKRDFLFTKNEKCGNNTAR